LIRNIVCLHKLSNAAGEIKQPLFQMNSFSPNAEPPVLTCAADGLNLGHEACPADGGISILALVLRWAQARRKVQASPGRHNFPARQNERER
jgi:hypothetical protein